MTRRLVLILLMACSLWARAETVTVGGKNYNESYLLAEIVSRLLEREGFEVDRRFGLGGTLVCYEALVNGEIDVYIEFTGTLEQAILKGDDRHPTVSELNRKVHPELRLLEPIGFNNTYAIVLKRELAARRSLADISDLAAERDLTMAFSLEFLNRQDGWPGLSRTYRLDHLPAGIEHGLAYQALAAGRIDVTDAYSTDGDLEKHDLAVLRDDKNYFPDYLAVPLVRKDLPARAIAAIGGISGRIGDEEMRRMNGEVIVAGRTFAEVADAFLLQHGLRREDPPQQGRAVRREAGLYHTILKNTLVHLKLTAIALALGCLLGLPLGILVYRYPPTARVVVYVAGLLQTIPSIALLALMIPLFGIGEVPAIVALFLYSILPILRNTITALVTIDPTLKRVAEALGMTVVQQLRRVLIPMALPTVLAGIKTAAIISIGTATLAAFIGAGGLGEPIVTGLALNDTRLILQGAIPAAALAVLVELLFEGLERMLVKPHMLKGQLPA